MALLSLGDAEQTLALVYWALGDVQAAMNLLKKAKGKTDAICFPLIMVKYEASEAEKR